LAWTLVDPRPDAIEFPDSIETAPPWELAAARPGDRVLVIRESDGRRSRDWLTIESRDRDDFLARDADGLEMTVPLSHVVSVDPDVTHA
jgi:hypothetical protein